MDTPLCVDLDGTLVKSDLLFESFLLLIKKNPFYLFLSVWWLIVGGKAHLKQSIAARVELNPALLPYTESFLSYLHSEKAKGRQLVLATASDMRLAKKVADYLGIFSEVIASDGANNLKGSRKRDTLNQKFGAKCYDYAGNAKEDLKVWRDSRAAILVNAPSKVVRQSKTISTVDRIFAEKSSRLKSIFKLLRIHQYVKNILVFIPLIVGHLLDSAAIQNSVIAFVIFCLLASSAYLLNDLLDIDADRQHRSKRKRAFASGDISISFGLICSPLFLVIGLALSMLLPVDFLLTVTVYYLLTIFYSFYFKKKMLVDVFVLAILYTVRIMAGIAAVQSEYSPWLISFSLFLFLSLAFVKRYSELDLMRKENKIGTTGRGYLVGDLPQLQLFGTISGYLSVLVLALYINSNNVLLLYRFSMFLWAICLLLLYWISRVWMLTTRGDLHDDPVIFALKDKVSWFTLLLTVITIIVATL